MPAKTPEPVISVQNFRMQFGHNTVIDDLSFEINPGETFGFLGSNGSGKTTTIRTLLGIYEPTAGTLHINGRRYSPEMSASLGYLPEERGLYQKEPVLDVMVYFGKLKGLTASAAGQWSRDYLERVGLGDKLRQPIGRLSGGQQQKVQLGVTIINQPELMILDEPTKGLDPVNRRLLMDVIEEHQRRGATVMLVTHQMEEVERLCQRIMLLKDGRRRLYGTIESIQNEYGESVIEIDFNGQLPKGRTYRVLNQTTSRATLSPNTAAQPGGILKELAAAQNLRLSRFEIQRSSLDDIFVKIYEEAKHS